MKAHVERHLSGHLRWLSNGAVLASWRLTPLQRPRTHRQSKTVAREHAELFRAFVGHRFWLESLLMWSDPAEVATAMIAGVDLATNPAWAATTEAAIDELAKHPLGSRRFILTVKLNLPPKLMVQSTALAVCNDGFEALAMAPLPPSDDMVAAAVRQAKRIEEAIPAAFAPTRLSTAEVVWSRRHAWSRTGTDLVDPVQAPELAEELLLDGATGLGTVHLDPHGATGLKGFGAKAAAAVRNRWIAVSDDLDHTSYQAGLVISQIPNQLAWPDSEFLGRVDDMGVPLDVTLTGTVRSNFDAIRKITHSMKQLNDQASHASAGGDTPTVASHQIRLNDAAQLAMDYTAELGRDRNLVEVESIMLLSVAGDSPEQVDEMAKTVMGAEVNREFTIARPIGQEENMFWLRQPGGIPSRQMNAHRQFDHSATTGTTAMVIGSVLGDETGIPVAINESSALRQIVHREPYGIGKTLRRVSPSIAFMSDQGGGKSYFAKTYSGHQVDRGARLIATDTTDEAEWVTFTGSLDTTVAVVDFRNPNCSIDPLRTLPPDLAGRVMQSFLVTLLDIDATGPQGRLLGKVLRPRFLADHNIGSAGELTRYLAGLTKTRSKAAQNDLDPVVALELADRIGVFADPDTDSGAGQAIFDPRLPAMDMDAQCQIWVMASVELPDQADLDNEHLFRTMSIEKRLGRAVYALYARHARELCFADKDAPALQNVDEFHHMTTSPEAMRVNADFLRKGRHYMAEWSAQSHLGRDFAGLGDLIRTRLVGRLSTDDAALEGALFLGASSDGDDDEKAAAVERRALADEILEHNAPGNGAAIMRDQRGNIGPVQLLAPFTQARRDAADTADALAVEDGADREDVEVPTA